MCWVTIISPAETQDQTTVCWEANRFKLKGGRRCKDVKSEVKQTNISKSDSSLMPDTVLDLDVFLISCLPAEATMSRLQVEPKCCEENWRNGVVLCVSSASSCVEKGNVSGICIKQHPNPLLCTYKKRQKKAQVALGYECFFKQHHTITAKSWKHGASAEALNVQHKLKLQFGCRNEGRQCRKQ